MAIYIKQVDRSCRHWRISVPIELVHEKGWDNVTHVRFEEQWGDRIVITRVATDEEPKEKDPRGTG